MNLGDARIVLRPRELGESLDLALLWCTSVARRTYLRLAAVLLVPSAIGCWLLHALAGWEWASVWLAAGLLATFLQAPFTLAAGALMFERDVLARTIVARFLVRLPVVIVVWIAGWLWIALGLALSLVGAAWTWPHVAFVREAALLEGMGPLAAMARARKFVARQTGDVLLLLFTFVPIVAVFVVCADQIDAALFEFMLQVGRPLGALFDDGGSLFALFGLFLAMPYVATVRFLRYIDARTRRDGWDLQLAFLALVVADDAARAQEES